MPKHRGTTLRRAFEILDVFHANPRPLSRREIEEALPDMGGVTIYNYLADLEEGGFIECTTPALGRGRAHFFQLGPRLVELGASVARRERAKRGSAV